jgi:formate hydrogenlyase transcriptional activator
VRGDAFFATLVKNFAQVVGVQRAFITECTDASKRRVRKLAQWDDGAFTASNEFDLDGTACETVI